MNFLKFWVGSSILTATIIGAGIFSLPYVFSKSGWLIALIYLAVFASVFSLVHILYADIVLRSKKNFLFLGFARAYLGKPGYWVSFVAVLCGMLLALTAYLVLSTSFVNLLGLQFQSLPHEVKIFGFWALASFAIFLNVRSLALSEFLVSAVMVAIVAIIFISGYFSGFDIFLNNAVSTNYTDWLLPFGAVLFALSGRTAIHPLIQYFKNEKLPMKFLPRAIILGTVAPAVIYLAFSFGVVALSSPVTMDAVSGMAHLSSLTSFVLGLLGLLALWSSYIVISLSVKDLMVLDLGLENNTALASVIFLPAILYFLGFKNFLFLVSLVGGVFLATESIIIVLIWRKMNNSLPRIITGKGKFFIRLGYLLIAVFSVGILFEFSRLLF